MYISKWIRKEHTNRVTSAFVTLCFLTAIGLVLVLSHVLSRFLNNDTAAWFSGLGTMVSVAFAAGIGLYQISHNDKISRKQARQENENKEKALKGAFSELTKQLLDYMSFEISDVDTFEKARGLEKKEYSPYGLEPILKAYESTTHRIIDLPASLIQPVTNTLIVLVLFRRVMKDIYEEHAYPNFDTKYYNKKKELLGSCIEHIEANAKAFGNGDTNVRGSLGVKS